MLSSFRALVKSPVAKVLIALLVASFAIWGIKDVFRNTVSGDTVITAGARTVSADRFRQMFQDELKQYNQQSGQSLTVQDALAHNIDRQVADAIAADEALSAYIDRIGIRPSDKQIVGEVAKAPQFFNAVSGRFDRQAYEAFVAQLGMTPPQFEAILRSELAQTQFVSGAAAGMRAPLLFSALSAAYDGEGRTFSYFVLPPTSVPAPAQPTDAELQGFIKEHSAQLMQPETRVFTVAPFSTSLTAKTIPADPSAVQKRFDFEKDALSSPEKRTLVEIPVKDAATGAAVAARLQKGEAPQAIARSLGVQPIPYTDSAKAAVVDKKLADAAFAMAAGEVKGPVQGDFGLAVIKVFAVTPAHTVTLDEVRDRIAAQARTDTARAQVNKAVQTYEDARSGGSNLINAAKAAGVKTTTLPPITAQSQTLQRQQVSMPPALLKAGMALQPGQDSDIVDLGQGEYAAIRLEKVIAPSPPPLDQIRPLLTRFMMQQALMKALGAKADAIADQVRKGQSMEAAAASAHATLGNGVDIQRASAGQSFGNELLSHLFSAKPGEVVTGPDTKVGMVVARLQAYVPASGPTAAQAAADQRQPNSQALVQDFASAVREVARTAIQPKVDYKRARAALGGGDASAQ